LADGLEKVTERSMRSNAKTWTLSASPRLRVPRPGRGARQGGPKLLQGYASTRHQTNSMRALFQYFEVGEVCTCNCNSKWMLGVARKMLSILRFGPMYPVLLPQ
jgi:hypothetical protein